MRFDGEDIRLSNDTYDNYIQVDNEDYILTYLNADFQSNKGASSNVFILQDPNGEVDDKVIKICKTPWTKNSRIKRLRRFEREIEAFRIAQKKRLSNVIQFFKSGKLELAGRVFLFIILEKAENDLASFMEYHQFNFTPNQKLTICVSILNGVKQLHDSKIYHRDIKHDNVLLVNGEFKIGDLGLVDFQNADFELDAANEKIGPTGWLSPEATNKMLTQGKKVGFSYDCKINHKSDIFQLGKLFWYIFQGNLPTGQINMEDCRFGDEELYNVLYVMMKHSKNERPEISEILTLLTPIKLRLAV